MKNGIEKPDPDARKKLTKREESGYLSSGSTLLNLACTNSPFGAFPKGKYIYLVGDSTSGKTFISMSCFAESLISPEFKNYSLIYDNVEDGCLIDLEALFSRKVAERVKAPGYSKEKDPIYSSNIEEFYFFVDDAVKDAIKTGKPFIYILDSMDGLTSEAEEEKFDEQKEAYRKGKDISGSYGDGKAKKNSTTLRKILRGIRDTGSILIIISQTRDSLKKMGYQTKTRAGGHALRFYATIEIWSSLKGKIQKEVKGRKRDIGINAGLQIKKNRITGELHEIGMDIYPSYGIDDIGANIDFLLDEKWWEKDGQKIEASEFKVTATKEKLIRYIEENNLERKLQTITGRCWNEIRNLSNIPRRKRYEEEEE